MTDQVQEWIEYCVKRYPCKGHVLEVGSFDVNGNPRHHFSDKERFQSYIGIDMREGPGVDQVQNVQNMTFADDSFDVIVDAERLEHDNRFWVSVKELYRVCKPGGYIIVTTRSWGGMHPHAYPHDYWRFMDSGLKDLLEYGGFKVLATAYGEQWAAGHKAVFAVAQKPFLKVHCLEEPRPLSVVILSKNADNLQRCIRAIANNDPELNVVVVDDGLQRRFGSRGITTVKGGKPFIFARNANIGIRQANSDVILLNDDAILETPNGFSKLASVKRGIVSAAIRGKVGNPEQVVREGESVRNASMLCFMAVFIPKWVQDKIGLLDERFVGYGFEDNDYSKRALDAGIQLSVYDGCVVEHESLPSTFRTKDGWTDLMAQNQKIYQDKWRDAH